MQKKTPQLSVHLVTWNGVKYIPELFASLKKQTYTDWQLIVFDNSSADDTVKCIKEASKDFPVSIKIIEHDENSGFAGGHNRLYRKCKSPYLVLLNQDMYLQPDCLEKLIAAAEEDTHIAALSPRLMRWNFQEEKQGSAAFTDDIDALGLKVFRNRRVIEQYTQESWTALHKQFGKKKELAVFGVSGALPLFRKSALDAVAFEDGTFLDKTYHSYKEDVDLAFRLQEAGFDSKIILDAVAYHDRSAAGPKELSDKAAMTNKKKQSSWVKYHSYKNHLRTLYKNEYWQNFFLDLPWIVWYETKKFIWFLLFDRSVLKGWKEIWKMRRDTKQKRQQIIKKRSITWREMRRWWK